jgi:hypothetical protein
MNALEKDKSILELIAMLPIDAMGWIVIDHWQADRFALGIAHPRSPRRLVYVSTFRCSPHRYNYECEVPSGGSSMEFDVNAAADGVNFEELLQVIREHVE